LAGAFLGGVVCALVVLVVVQLLRPLPPVAMSFAVPARLVFSGPDPALPWSGTGEGRVDVEGLGTIGALKAGSAVPVASLTKMMTALLVLRDHPLSLGQSGPLITVTPSDVSTYVFDNNSDQSTVEVTAGEQLSELQALEAMLIPSGNNIAYMLARWDARNVSAFVAKMNAEAASLGLTATHYVDPSGFDSDNTSSASDEIRVARAALQDPVFASIVSRPSVDLPVAGTLYNTNFYLGQDGIAGVKTGSSSEAGGCFVFLAHQDIDGEKSTVIGAVLSQDGLDGGLSVGRQLVAATFSSLRVDRFYSSGQIVGALEAPWSSSVPVATAVSLSLLGTGGMRITSNVQRLDAGSNVERGARVAELTLRLGAEHASAPLVSTERLRGPSVWWRLLRS
jgi:serine-type D-Ala-D-Ala carboxypeptidase (penicillin-binding protein 5/6)